MAKVEELDLKKQYEIMIDLYKFYFERLVQTNVYALGIIGAVLSFYIANRQKDQVVAISVALPFLVSLGMMVMCGVSVFGISRFHIELQKLATELGIRRAPNTLVLIVGFATFSVIHALVALVVGLYYFSV